MEKSASSANPGVKLPVACRTAPSTSGGKNPPSPPAAPTSPVTAPTDCGKYSGTSLNTAPVAQPDSGGHSQCADGERDHHRASKKNGHRRRRRKDPQQNLPPADTIGEPSRPVADSGEPSSAGRRWERRGGPARERNARMRRCWCHPSLSPTRATRRAISAAARVVSPRVTTPSARAARAATTTAVIVTPSAKTVTVGKRASLRSRAIHCAVASVVTMLPSWRRDATPSAASAVARAAASEPDPAISRTTGGRAGACGKRSVPVGRPAMFSSVSDWSPPACARAGTCDPIAIAAASAAPSTTSGNDSGLRIPTARRCRAGIPARPRPRRRSQ